MTVHAHTRAILDITELRPGNPVMLSTGETMLHCIVERCIAPAQLRDRRVIVRTHTSSGRAVRYQLRGDAPLGGGFTTIALQRSFDQLPLGLGRWRACSIDLLT